MMQWTALHQYSTVCVCLCMYTCVCVRVCPYRNTEKWTCGERKWGKNSMWWRQTESDWVCICVSVACMCICKCVCCANRRQCVHLSSGNRSTALNIEQKVPGWARTPWRRVSAPQIIGPIGLVPISHLEDTHEHTHLCLLGHLENSTVHLKDDGVTSGSVSGHRTTWLCRLWVGRGMDHGRWLKSSIFNQQPLESWAISISPTKFPSSNNLRSPFVYAAAVFQIMDTSNKGVNGQNTDKRDNSSEVVHRTQINNPSPHPPLRGAAFW